jgi:Cft2 family RNA processing exonuclease
MKIYENSQSGGGGVKIKFEDSLTIVIDPESRSSNVNKNFVSHSHLDHCKVLGYSKNEVYLTPESFEIAKVRFKKINANTKIVTFGEEFTISVSSNEKFSFHPAGHVLGSSQILIKTKNNKKIVYTGDFKLKRSNTLKGSKPLECDILIIECMYGFLNYRFPKIDEISKEITKWVEKVLRDNFIPVLIGNPLGQGQELTKMLSEKFDVFVFPTIFNLNKIYEKFEINLGNYEVSSEPVDEENSVFIAPTWFLNNMVKKKKCCIALCTGWALNPEIKFAYGVDEAFPLSNHADFQERVEYIKKSNPEEVITHHGPFSEEFANWIERNLGISARPLRKEKEPQKRIFEF